MALIFLVVIAALIAFGVWRKFGPIQWIWLMFGAVITLLVIWFLVVAFIIGPEMVRTAPAR
jgi:hypothetical protein